MKASGATFRWAFLRIVSDRRVKVARDRDGPAAPGAPFERIFLIVFRLDKLGLPAKDQPSTLPLHFQALPDRPITCFARGTQAVGL